MVLLQQNEQLEGCDVASGIFILFTAYGFLTELRKSVEFSAMQVRYYLMVNQALPLLLLPLRRNLPHSQHSVSSYCVQGLG